MSTDANYAPQSFIDDKGKLVGFEIDVSKEVAKRLGVKAIELGEFDRKKGQLS